jgi:hypothetical protein
MAGLAHDSSRLTPPRLVQGQHHGTHCTAQPPKSNRALRARQVDPHDIAIRHLILANGQWNKIQQ